MNILGLVLVFFAIVLCFFQLADDKLKFIKEISELKHFLINISHQLSTYKVSIAKAVDTVVLQNTYTNKFILKLNLQLEHTNSFKKAYEECKDYLVVDTLKSAMENLSNVLGICELDTQLLAIERCCENFDEMLKEFSEKHKVEAALYKKLGVLAGILAVIILY